MYIVIDRDNLRVLHKHADQKIASNLANLECPQVSIVVTFCDEKGGFSLLTDLELKLLIKNSNGPDVSRVFSRDSLADIMCKIAQAFPSTENVNGFELQMQLASLAEDDSEPYRYLRGSMKPQPAAGLAELAALHYSGAAIAAPASAPLPVVQGTVALDAFGKPLGPGGACPPAVMAKILATGDFTAPREGTSTHSIFTFCATAWKESGYQDSKATLDNIKKKAIDVLCAQGLNISTVRTQAQRWYQHRQQFVI